MNEEDDTLLHEICADPDLMMDQDTVTKDPLSDKISDQPQP